LAQDGTSLFSSLMASLLRTSLCKTKLIILIFELLFLFKSLDRNELLWPVFLRLFGHSVLVVP